MGNHRVMKDAFRSLSRIGLSGAVWACCIALPVQALTLTEAYQSALLHDPFFQSDFYAAQAGMEEDKLGFSGLLPEVSLNARRMDNRGQRDITSNSQVTNETLAYQSMGGSLNLRQPLFNMERFSAFNEGKLRAGIAESQLASGKQNAILRVTGTYLDAMIARQDVQLAIAKKNTITAQAEQLSMLSDKGEATSTDAGAVQSKLVLVQIQENEANDVQLSRISALSQLTGRNVDALPEIVFDAGRIGLGSALLANLDQWSENAIARNPELIQKQRALELAEVTKNKYRSSYLPVVDLVANVTRNNQDSFTTLNQDVRNRAIGIELNWPLFKGGYYAGLIRQASAKVEQAKQDIASAKLRIRLEVERQYRGTVTGRLKIAALSQIIKTDTEKIKSAELLFAAGVKTKVDVFTAQQDLAQSYKDYYDAFKEFIMAQFKLAASTDSLGDDDVTGVEKYLQSGKIN